MVFRILLLLFPVVSFCQNRTSAVLLEKSLKKYALEKGTISYTISGDASGEESFVFDRYGWRNVKRRTMEFELYGITSTQVLHEVGDGEQIYRISHADSTYTRRVDMKWSSQASYMDPVQVSESVLFGLGGQYQSDSTHLGKSCQVWTFTNKSLQEMWVWQGLVVKRISKLGEKTVITLADQIDLDTAIDESLFDLPSSYQLSE